MSTGNPPSLKRHCGRDDPAKNFTFLERSKNVAPMFAERSLWTSVERTFVNYAKRSLNVRQ